MSVIDSLLIEIGVDASKVSDGINQARSEAQGFADWIKGIFGSVDKAIDNSGKKAKDAFSKPLPPKPQDSQEPKAEPPKAPETNGPQLEPPEEPKVEVRAPKIEVDTPDVRIDDIGHEFVDELKTALNGLRDGLREAIYGTQKTVEIPKEPEKPRLEEHMALPPKPRSTIRPARPARKDFENYEEYEEAQARYRETVKDIKKEDQKAFDIWEKKVEPIRQYNEGVDQRNAEAMREYKDRLEEIKRLKKENNQVDKEGSQIVANLTSKLRSMAASYVTLKSLISRGQSAIMLRDLSLELRISVKELDKWGRAFKIAGYNADSAYDALGKIKNGLRDVALTGRNETIGMLNFLEVELRNADGTFKESGEILVDTAKKLRQLDPGKARKFAEMAGFDRDTINLLLDTKVSFEELMELAGDGTVNDELAESVKEFQRAWRNMTAIFMKIGNVILKYVIGPLTAIVEAINSVLKAFASCDAGVLLFMTGILALTGKLGALVAAFTSVAKIGGTFLGFIRDLIGAFTGLMSLGTAKTGLMAWLGRLLSLGGRLNPVTGAILLLGGALRELWKFFNEGDSIFDWFLKKLGLAEETIKSIKDTIKGWFNLDLEPKRAQTDYEEDLVGTMVRQVSNPDAQPVANNTVNNSQVNTRNQSAQFNTTINVTGDVKDKKALQRTVEEGVSKPFNSWRYVSDSGNF